MIANQETSKHILTMRALLNSLCDKTFMSIRQKLDFRQGKVTLIVGAWPYEKINEAYRGILLG